MKKRRKRQETTREREEKRKRTKKRTKKRDEKERKERKGLEKREKDEKERKDRKRHREREKKTQKKAKRSTCSILILSHELSGLALWMYIQGWKKYTSPVPPPQPTLTLRQCRLGQVAEQEFSYQMSSSCETHDSFRPDILAPFGDA
jgi:hypothetical protein